MRSKKLLSDKKDSAVLLKRIYMAKCFSGIIDFSSECQNGGSNGHFQKRT